ncbi:DUF4386 family protein [uncultured Aliiroseovarius sp.]|uniref:DUF4386 family protein n=1 Tax=uncultured Aliiroseovarius sp. TaxID=1658783 RepID=UPI0026222499|nr:DUF4386 family protein [uncultured Aliiroseovarius sp.]
MTGYRTAGAIGGIVCAATYLFGIVIMVAVLEPAGFGTQASTPEELLAFLSAQQSTLSVWYLVIYVVNAVALAALVIALRALLHPHAPVLSDLSLGFGLIWATLVMGAGMIANVGLAETLSHTGSAEQAAQLWHMVTTIENGLGGGNEIAGSVWVIAVGLAAWTSGILPRLLNAFGFVIGGCGLLTILPPLEAFGMVFGLGFILWFAWVGVVLLRRA